MENGNMVIRHIIPAPFLFGNDDVVTRQMIPASFTIGNGDVVTRQMIPASFTIGDGDVVTFYRILPSRGIGDRFREGRRLGHFEDQIPLLRDESGNRAGRKHRYNQASQKEKNSSHINEIVNVPAKLMIFTLNPPLT